MPGCGLYFVARLLLLAPRVYFRVANAAMALWMSWQGEYCRIWDGSRPIILQPKDEPYVFNSPVFRLATMEADGYPAFINQSEKVIEHGIHHIITVPSGEAGWPDVTVTARACALRVCALRACALRGCAFHACALRGCAFRGCALRGCASRACAVHANACLDRAWCAAVF